MARRDIFPFLTSFFAFLAVYSPVVYGCDNGYYSVRMPNAGLFGHGGTTCQKCPAGYPNSDNGTTKQEQCYKIIGGHSSQTRVYYGSVECGRGKYLPKNSDSCAVCLDGCACTGGWFQKNPNEDQGIIECTGGLVPDTGRSKCIDPEHSGQVFIHCPVNYYLPAGTIHPALCRSGCVCPGGDYYYSDREEQGINCGTLPRQCDAGKYYDAESDDCLYCPTDFPLSAANSVGRESCYGTYNNKQLYYKEHNCTAGNYLPKKTDTCESCLSWSNYACPGGKFFPSPSIDQGLIQCLSGQTPNSSHTQCSGGQTQCKSGQYYTSNTCKDCPNGFSASDANATKKEQCYTSVGGTKLYYKSVKCDPGTYLKQSTGVPSHCADGYVCYGGTYWTSTTKDQGLKTCSGGKIPNANQTGCTYEENYGTVVSCNPGEYLPAGLGRCRKCSNKAKYCPGGALTSSTTDQGLVDCPYGATANSDFTSCNFTLSQIKLKFGPKGKSTAFSNQCWTLTNIKEYARCVLRYTGPIASSGGSIKVEKETIQMQQNAPDLK